MISLADAIKTQRIQEFIEQEGERGIGPIEHADFEALAFKLIKVPQSENQTSHFSSGDDLTGKKLAKVAIHMLLADMDMGGIDRILE